MKLSLVCYLPQVDPFVMSELPVGHVSVVSNDLPDMFWRHVFLLSIHKPKFPLLCIALGLQLLPFSSYKSTSV